MRTEKGERNVRRAGAISDAEFDQVLGNFKTSIHAWSEASYSRPRTVAAVKHRTWRLAAGWALGCVLIAGTLTGGIHERHFRLAQARMAAAEQARQKQLAASEQSRAADDADLMATVDTDVSREVPSAMEPLAQLMDDGANQ